MIPLLAALPQCDRDVERVVQPRRLPELDPHRAHREDQVVFGPHQFLALAACAQPFGARAFQERQVLRVVDHATGVGIFPINPCRPTEHRFSRHLHLPQAHGRTGR